MDRYINSFIDNITSVRCKLGSCYDLSCLVLTRAKIKTKILDQSWFLLMSEFALYLLAYTFPSTDLIVFILLLPALLLIYQERLSCYAIVSRSMNIFFVRIAIFPQGLILKMRYFCDFLKLFLLIDSPQVTLSLQMLK